MKLTKQNRGLGYKPSKFDPRDYQLKTKSKTVYKKLPSHLDAISKHINWVYDQEQTSSCTGNSSESAQRYARIIHKLPDLAGSRLYPYYYARLTEGDPEGDNGAEIRDVIKSLAMYGTPPEEQWPFTVENVTKQPPQELLGVAKLDEITKYYTVKQTLDDMKLCLFEGYPIVFGTNVYEEFESDQVAETGIVPMPSDSEQSIGGHAILATGFDDDKKQFKVLNSWGSSWGDHGYCYFPYDYLLNTDWTNDIWTIRLTNALPSHRRVIQPHLKNRKVELTS